MENSQLLKEAITAASEMWNFLVQDGCAHHLPKETQLWALANCRENRSKK